MNSQWLRSIPVRIGAVVIGLVLILDVFAHIYPRFSLPARLEWITYDWRMRQATRVPQETSTNLGFVHIGDDTIELFSRGELNTNFQFGLYWPRHIYGLLVNELNAQGAKAIGLDVLFAEERPEHKPIEIGTNLISPDHYFAGILQRAGNVVLAADHKVLPVALFRDRARGLGMITTELDADGVLRRARAFYDFRIWNERIKKQARLQDWNLDKVVITSNKFLFPGKKGTRELSVTDGLFDPYELLEQKPPGGIVRLEPAYEDVRVWHLGITLAALELGLDLKGAEVDLKRGRISLSSTNGVRRILPVDKYANLLIDWRIQANKEPLTQASFETVVADHLQRRLGTNVGARFKDKLVVVGSTAVGNELSDRGATPLEKDTFLTSNHWNVTNSIITGKFIRVAPRWLDLAVLCLLGIAGGVFACKLSTMRAAIVTVLLAAVYVGAALTAFIFARHWIPMVTPLVSLLAGYVALVTYQAFFEETEKRRVRDVFSKVVSPSVVQELLKATNLSLVGKRRRVTAMFADIRGFTEMTDRSHEQAEDTVRQESLDGVQAERVFDRESQEVLETVNLYLSTIADKIKKQDGTLDKYIGDCVMAFWGAPIENERHAVCCVQAAIEAQRAIHCLNEERRQENARRERANFERVALGQTPSRLRLLDLLTVGVGINTGMVDAGLMGSQDAQNYTIFGRDVNVASRLEKLAGSARVLIGEQTYVELKKHDPALASTCIELPPTEVRGIREAIKIYEVPWK